MTRLPLVVLVLLGILAGCVRPIEPLPPPQFVAAPSPSDVDRVLFLLGDPGEARGTNYPILVRIQQDIEWWSESLAADTAVALLILGDLIYPDGLPEPGTAEFPADSAILMDQVHLVAGPAALRRGTQAYFIPGNHDWGLDAEHVGPVRLQRIEDFLEAAAAETGAGVRLAPEAGKGGPHVVDWGRVRLLLLDTAWWLVPADDAARTTTLEQVDSAMAGAGDRDVLFAAHHPFASAGEHGGSRKFWELFGFEYILNRSGAILQDLSSIPYQRLLRGLRAIFARRGPPLAFIGGHEHNLQVLDAVEPTDPRYSLVSGSGSKLTAVGRAPGLRYGEAVPGYIRLVFEKNGGVIVFVEAVSEEYLSCPSGEPGRSECMARGVAAFRTVYSQRLR